MKYTREGGLKATGGLGGNAQPGHGQIEFLAKTLGDVELKGGKGGDALMIGLKEAMRAAGLGDDTGSNEEGAEKSDDHESEELLQALEVLTRAGEKKKARQEAANKVT